MPKVQKQRGQDQLAWKGGQVKLLSGAHSVGPGAKARQHSAEELSRAPQGSRKAVASFTAGWAPWVLPGPKLLFVEPGPGLHVPHPHPSPEPGPHSLLLRNALFAQITGRALANFLLRPVGPRRPGPPPQPRSQGLLGRVSWARGQGPPISAGAEVVLHLHKAHPGLHLFGELSSLTPSGLR